MASLERLIPDASEREAFTESAERYADAVGLAAQLRAEWEKDGRPLTAEGSMRQPIPHPLVKMIADADRDAAKYAAAVGLDAGALQKKGRSGRPVGATSAPDRREPPRIRRVK